MIKYSKHYNKMNKIRMINIVGHFKYFVRTFHVLGFLIYFVLLGVKEATDAGKTLKRGGYVFDIAFTSVLSRAQCTLCTILAELEQQRIPIFSTWRLNERHYGSLTGLNKAEVAAEYGEEQVAKNAQMF